MQHLLINQEIRFFDSYKQEYRMFSLTKEYARNNIQRLLYLHNLIPFVNWSDKELLSDKIGQRTFHNKWLLSVGIVNSENNLISFMLVYERFNESNHPFHSLYLHRMAIDPFSRSKGIGKQVFRNYISTAFNELPEIHFITLQTNNVNENQWVVKFYQSLGFQCHSIVHYPEKDDWLMVLNRASFFK